MIHLQRLTISSDQITQRSNDSCIALTLEQYHYLHRVLRLEAGDQFLAMDGVGHGWLSELVPESQSAQIVRQLADEQLANSELPIAVTLVAALPKGNGFDEVVRQVTELGVTRIVPVISDRTLLKPSDNRLKRWQRIANEAAEQSERVVIPTVHEPISLSQFFQQSSDYLLQAKKYIGVARGHWPSLAQQLQVDIPPPSGDHATAGNTANELMGELIIAIGPEGGWTAEEIECAIAVGYQPVSLGKRVLRAVTAPVVALSIAAAVLERDLSE